MAPKRAMKGRSPSPKRARRNPVLKAVDAVTEAIGSDDQAKLVEGLPDNARKMLGKAVASALGPGAASDERHGYQSKIASAIGEVLGKCVTEVWEKKVAEAKADVALAEKAKDDAMASQDTAESELSAANGKRGDAETLLEDAKTAHKDAEEKRGLAQDQVDTLEVQHSKKEAEKTKGCTILEENFTTLKTVSSEGTAAWEKAEKKLMGPLKAEMTKLGVDCSLLSAIGSALEKTPGERGPFDAMVVDNVEDHLKKNIAKLDEFLTNFESTKAEKQAAVDAAQAKLDAAAAHETSCEEALATAKANETAAETKVKECKGEVAAKEKELAKANEELSDKEDSLATAKENLASFTFLLDRPKVAPEPPAEEPAAVEAA